MAPAAAVTSAADDGRDRDQDGLHLLGGQSGVRGSAQGDQERRGGGVHRDESGEPDEQEGLGVETFILPV
jgi:hypothetical protein